MALVKDRPLLVKVRVIRGNLPLLAAQCIHVNRWARQGAAKREAANAR